MWKKQLKKLGLPESYISITLGFLVVIVAGVLIYNYFAKGRLKIFQPQETQVEEQKEEKPAELPTTHQVAKGETLWSIALKYYNSGYNWVTISSENKLANPNRIEVGQKLTIPKAEVIRPPSEKVLSTATQQEETYTVVKGDHLWKIAVNKYGDGYAWVRIAKANNLVNPNLIHAGNVLKIPK